MQTERIDLNIRKGLTPTGMPVQHVIERVRNPEEIKAFQRAAEDFVNDLRGIDPQARQSLTPHTLNDFARGVLGFTDNHPEALHGISQLALDLE